MARPPPSRFDRAGSRGRPRCQIPTRAIPRLWHIPSTSAGIPSAAHASDVETKDAFSPRTLPRSTPEAIRPSGRAGNRRLARLGPGAMPQRFPPSEASAQALVSGPFATGSIQNLRDLPFERRPHRSASWFGPLGPGCAGAVHGKGQRPFVREIRTDTKRAGVYTEHEPTFVEKTGRDLAAAHISPRAAGSVSLKGLAIIEIE